MFRRSKTQDPAPSAPEPVSQPNRLAPRSPSEAIKPTAAPPPPEKPVRERGGLLSAVSGLLTLFVILGLGAILGIVVLERQTNEAGPLPADKVVVVPRSSVGEMAELLQREGVIGHPMLFELTARFGRKAALKAGEYNFKAHASIDDVVDVLVQGRPVQHAITFPEGLTSEQIVARLNDNDVLTGDINENPAGGLAPARHLQFERGDSRQKILNLMRTKQREVLNQIWARRSPDVPRAHAPGDGHAGLDRREGDRPGRRAAPRVAGVFVNRLQKRMRLQSDPTIVYAWSAAAASRARHPALRDRPGDALQQPTRSWPAAGADRQSGPAALEAVANPSRTKELFFVADGTGGHVFAETLEAHNRNVARWRQVEKAKAAADPGTTIGVDKVEPPGAGRPGGRRRRPAAAHRAARRAARL